MSTPDYLEQVVVSNRRQQTNAARRTGTRTARISVTGLVWAGLDGLSAAIAGLLAYRMRLADQVVPQQGTFLHTIGHQPMQALLYLLIFAGYVVLFARFYGLYRVSDNRSGLHEQRMTLQATLTAGLLFCGTLYVAHAYEVSRLVVLYSVAITAFLVAMRRAVWRKLRHRRFLEGLEVRNVLIVGDGRVGHALRNHLESLPHMGFRFKGFVTLDGQSHGGDMYDRRPMRRSDDGAATSQVVGDIRNCVALARSLFVDEIYFSTPADKELVMQVLEEARALSIDVRVVPDLYDGLAWNAPVEYIGQFPTIPLHRGDFPRGAFMMKRAMDVSLSSVLLLALSPIMVLLAILVRLDSSGPVFYKAERIGRKGRMFRCYKFRTMVVNADKLKKDLAHLNTRADDMLFKIADDPRVTKIGKKLRKHSLDELPQLFNVLKGDMSLVGPRPPLASEVAKYNIEHLRRLDVLPGMTGLWQVEARQDPSFDSYISLDTAYVENWNLMLDLRILARTIGVVLEGTGS
jgi:exopolysaccharide biosynthesis polyprenyl glycosylphosphotransferase